MDGGAKGSRTPDLYTASVALYQLSYGPLFIQKSVIGWSTHPGEKV
jgi:hypothetical protein